MKIIKLIAGLIMIMGANIFLGYSLAKTKEEFNIKILIKGLKKVICLISSLLLIYVCCFLNPNILVIEIDGMDINLIKGVKLLFESGIVYYGGQSLIKLAQVLKIPSSIAINNIKKQL